jgi:sigma54-dependent transcription regulator
MFVIEGKRVLPEKKAWAVFNASEWQSVRGTGRPYRRAAKDGRLRKDLVSRAMAMSRQEYKT